MNDPGSARASSTWDWWRDSTSRRQRVELALVFTSPTCPMGDAIADEAWQALQQAFPEREVQVEEALGVPWDPSRLSEGARERLGWNDRQA